MGVGPSKCAACCGDKDEAGNDVSIQPLEGSGLAGTEEVAETKRAPSSAEENPSKAKASEQATLNFKDDATYTGGVVDGKRDGYGTYKSPTETYEGQWKDDKQNGDGKHTWSDGRSYEGQYVNGRFSGKGKMVWRTDKGTMIYEGDYLDDAKHGSGKFTWPNGNVYEGGWQNGKRHGKATFITSTGKQKVGFWHDDKFVKWEGDDAEPSQA
ncbi:PIP5K1 [Symbiodinium sp. CCMP2456]|nr:PIP5K1 [Symbiodinium sp. CCMP2456]